MKKIIWISSIVLILIMVLISKSYAMEGDGGATKKGSNYGIVQPTIDTKLVGNIGGIIFIVQIIGTAVAVGASIYLGMKYMIASAEEKANVKKKWIPFVVGAIIFFGATGILKLISLIAGWF